MRNALLQSMSSQLYNFGNNEVHVPNLDVSMQMDSEVNVHGSAFGMKSVSFNNDDLMLRNGCFTVPFGSLINYSHQSGYQSGGTSSSADIPQQLMFLSKKPSVPQFEAVELQAMPNARKRPIEINDVLPKRDSDMLGDMKVLNEWEKNKRNKATTTEQEWQHQVGRAPMQIQEQKLHVPVRRSHKLSDKITALQKLVSPYGKTDTSSVLQEASLYIKLLHEQIQMLSSSYKSVGASQQRQEIGEQQDLKSKGLCLVPVTFTQKVKMESPVDLRALCWKPITQS
ncbi:transcription factor bHLH114-like isoform X1 [Fagus crenata]